MAKLLNAYLLITGGGSVDLPFKNNRVGLLPIALCGRGNFLNANGFRGYGFRKFIFYISYFFDKFTVGNPCNFISIEILDYSIADISARINIKSVVWILTTTSITICRLDGHSGDSNIFIPIETNPPDFLLANSFYQPGSYPMVGTIVFLYSVIHHFRAKFIVTTSAAVGYCTGRNV